MSKKVNSGILAMGRIEFTGGGLISGAEHSASVNLAVESLVRGGYKNVSAAYDPRTEMIEIGLLLPDAESVPHETDISDILEAGLASAHTPTGEPALRGDARVVSDLDYEFTIYRGVGPMGTLLHSRGGNWLNRVSEPLQCTSGWSVSGPNGDGMVTAGHCNGLNRFHQPGVPPYSMKYRKQVVGSSGDVEYHTTSHSELAEFYANSIIILDVNDVKRNTSSMMGMRVCSYGRASNVRNCDHVVDSTLASFSVDGTIIGNLVRTDNISNIEGDSGGGFSRSTTAWGVLSGVTHVDVHSYFTPVARVESLLGVMIKEK